MEFNRKYIPKRIYSITNIFVGERNMRNLLDTWKISGVILDYA